MQEKERKKRKKNKKINEPGTVPIYFHLRYNTDISALKMSRYRDQSDISMPWMIYTFMTYFEVCSDIKAASIDITQRENS